MLSPICEYRRKVNRMHALRDVRRKTEIAIGDCIKDDIERVGEERGNMTDRRNWRPLRELSMRKERGRKKIMEKENHGQLILDDSDAKKIITTKCNLTLV